MLKLFQIEPKHLDLIRAGLQEIKDNRTPYDIFQAEKAIEFMDKNFDGFFEYLEQQRSENQPDGRVPNTTLWLFDDDRFIGLYNIRHRLNDVLTKSGGHIAYQIIPSERNKGYVKAGLKLVLKWCKENLGLDEALLSCNAQNIGSDKAMTSVMNEWGGKRRPDVIIDGHIDRSVWINTQKQR